MQLAQLWRLDLLRPLAASIDQISNPDDWEKTFVTAEFAIAEGDRDAAEAKLWSLFDPRFATKSLATWTAPMPTGVLISSRPAAIPEVAYRERRLNGLTTLTPPPFAPDRNLHNPYPDPIQTIYDARDHALLYLAMIATNAQRAPAFLEKLTALTAPWPQAERIVTWGIVQNPEGLIREISAYASQPRSPQLDRLCYDDDLSAMQRLQPGSPLALKVGELLRQFPRPANPPRQFPTPEESVHFLEVYNAFRTGRYDETRKAFDDTVIHLRRLGHSSTAFWMRGIETSLGMMTVQSETQSTETGRGRSHRRQTSSASELWKPESSTVESGERTLWPHDDPGREGFHPFRQNRASP